MASLCYMNRSRLCYSVYPTTNRLEQLLRNTSPSDGLTWSIAVLVSCILSAFCAADKRPLEQALESSLSHVWRLF